MNRIDEKFKELRARKEKAFIVYLTSGYPDLSSTKRLILELEKTGVDIIELGVPFSDPLADGPIIQRSSQCALKRGVTLSKIMDLAAAVRKSSRIPLVMMSYYNPINAYGLKRFVKRAKICGIDGLIVPDLPVEEGLYLNAEMKKAGLDQIFLVAPTSTSERIKHIAKASRGFIYYVSLTGVTGVRNKMSADIKEHINTIRRVTKKPVCIGFGVSSPKQVRSLRGFSDGLITGSAVIEVMEKNSGKNIIPATAAFAKKMVKACKVNI